jgi:tRNA G18 (ribose-2'-O)-methylase SpoU
MSAAFNSSTSFDPKRVNGKRIKEEKRQRFLEKQKRSVRQKQSKQPEWMAWIQENESFVLHANQETVNTAREDPSSPLFPYFDLQKEKNTGNSSLFICEGTETVRLLLQQSYDPCLPIQIESIFVKPSVMFESVVNLRASVEQAREKGASFRVIVGDDEIQTMVAGFPISRGALACGRIPQDRNNINWLLQYLSRRRHKHGDKLCIVALDGVSDTANLGSIVRSASAFHVDAIVLSRNCCSAWYRRAIRVSMGHIFRVPCIRVDNLPQFIQSLSNEPLSITSYAAIVDKQTDLVLERVTKGQISSSWMAVFGNEASGISKEVIGACNYTIRIDMDKEVDSLSLPIAAGILLHGLKEKSAPLP